MGKIVIIKEGIFAGQRGEVVSHKNNTVSIMLQDGIVFTSEENVTENGIYYA